MVRTFTVTFDANDPSTLAAFWKQALGYEFPDPPPPHETWEDFAEAHGIPKEKWADIAAIEDPDRAHPRLLFLRVPEGKTAKNRIHLDVHAGDRTASEDTQREQRAAVEEELIAAGATTVEERSDFNSTWIVMQDPEGNEFCVV